MRSNHWQQILRQELLRKDIVSCFFWGSFCYGIVWFFLGRLNFLLGVFPHFQRLLAPRKRLSSCPPWKSRAARTKNRPKSFTGKIFRAFWNRLAENFEIKNLKNVHRKFSLKIQLIFFDLKNFRKFSISKFFIFIQFSMKFFDENFSDFWISKISAGRFQNALKIYPVKLFGPFLS